MDERTSEWRVAGEPVESRCRFRCDSDSLIVKALAGLLTDLADEETPAELLRADVASFAAPEVQRLLASNRQNALSRVWDHLRAFAAQQAGSGAVVPDAPRPS